MVELCALIESALTSALQEDVSFFGPEGMLWLPLLVSFRNYWSSELAPMINVGFQRGVFDMPSLIREGEQRRFLLALPAGYHEAIEDTQWWLDHDSAHTGAEGFDVPSKGMHINKLSVNIADFSWRAASPERRAWLAGDSFWAMARRGPECFAQKLLATLPTQNGTAEILLQPNRLNRPQNSSLVESQILYHKYYTQA
jgi:hypothetical protein